MFTKKKLIGENDYENVIVGSGAERENVIKVFKDNGLENCLGGDANDAEEVFKICRVFGMDQEGIAWDMPHFP